MASDQSSNTKSENHADGIDAPVAPKRFTRKQLIVGVAGTMLIVGATIMVLMPRDIRPEPVKMLSDAFSALESGRLMTARTLSERLREIDYRDPDFSGAPEFILGMVAYRTASDASIDEVGRIQEYKLACKWFKEADKHIIAENRRAEWAFVYGKSLFHAGAVASAKPVLQEAIEKYPDGRVELTLMLTDILLDSRDSKDIQRALKINGDVLDDANITVADRDQLHLQRSQIFLALKQYQDAVTSLDALSEENASRMETQILRARTLMARENYNAAIELLSPLAQNLSTEQRYARQASYLLGVCRERLDDFENAIVDYQRTADRFRASHEGQAGLLRAASLLRKTFSNEKSLAAYQNVLSSIVPDEEYRNRWLGMEELREEVIAAWNDWVQRGVFQEAIALSQSMTSIFPHMTAIEYSADAYRKWAEFLQQQFDGSPPAERGALLTELRNHWNLSGRQYELLAETWKTTPRYTEALRLSAEHYRMGHDFEKSLNLWQRFIDVEPASGMPNAYIHQGEVLMDLDRFPEALRKFEHVIQKYPTDASRFTAEYLIGVCYLEQNELQKAEEIWRSIITGGNLAPSAREWRLALFALGRYLSNQSDILRWKASKEASLVESPQASPLLEESFLRAREAIIRLDEYVKRYPASNEITQARFLLAHSLQQVADQHRRKYAVAETENARQEQLKQMQDQLHQAIEEYAKLKEDLFEVDLENRIEPLDAFMLRECFFEIAHTHFALEEYDKAIAEYTLAVGKYPHDARAILAYLQMTRCFDRLGKPTEARSKLEQVKYILEGLPEDVFQPRMTNMTKKEWREWVEWAIRIYQQDRPQPILSSNDEQILN